MCTRHPGCTAEPDNRKLVQRSMTFTHLAVPRIPMTMEEVRMFMPSIHSAPSFSCSVRKCGCSWGRAASWLVSGLPSGKAGGSV